MSHLPWLSGPGRPSPDNPSQGRRNRGRKADPAAEELDSSTGGPRAGPTGRPWRRIRAKRGARGRKTQKQGGGRNKNEAQLLRGALERHTAERHTKLTGAKFRGKVGR